MLRIGRTAAYQLAQRALATGGAEGLRVVRVGRLLRVPRAALETLLGGPVTLPAPAGRASAACVTPARVARLDATDPDATEPASTSAPRRPRRSRDADQLDFPFAS